MSLRRYLGCVSLLSLAAVLSGQTLPPQLGPTNKIQIRTSLLLDSLVHDEDTDHDTKITVDDPHLPGTERGDKRFWLTTTDQQRYEVAGTYYLSNLLQELLLAQQAGADTASLSGNQIFEPPVDRISRSIRERYWDGLTRRIDGNHLMRVLVDEKLATSNGFYYLYTPATDKKAYEYFSEVAASMAGRRLRVHRLPGVITPQFVRNLGDRHGLLSLALETLSDGSVEGRPFVVPGGRFNEMYGWDSYFIVLGLLQDGRMDLARSIVDNVVYEIEQYGAVLNANRTYYLTRSQPPFLTSMTLAVYRQLPKDPSSLRWLRHVLAAAIKEYQTVWMGHDRLTETGLSRYYDSGTGPPPEVEPGHFDPVYLKYAERFGMSLQDFVQAYTSGKLHVPDLDTFFVNDRAMRESGHDTSYRLLGRCANLVTVDLNALLYKIECDVADILDQEFGGRLQLDSGTRETSEAWRERAAVRKVRVNRYQWDQTKGMFFDYDIVRRSRTGYVSATTLYPLWAGLASQEQAQAIVARALPLLTAPGGIVGSTEESRGPISPTRPERQWDYPYGWAPHQIIAWRGLQNYGFQNLAQSLIYRWLYTITLNAAQYNGTVPEKFDVVRRTHQVFAEYGNVGTKFSYITREGFGWTNASYQLGLSALPPTLRESLNRLIPPEWIFPE
jgi:alpha,alpha-trehalase